MIKKLILFFLIIIFLKISNEILIFNEEIILLTAGFIMFNLFIYIGWSILSTVLITRTNEIFFIFYDLFELKLKKLILFRQINLKKIEINNELNQIFVIIKLNLQYLYFIQILYTFSFEVYILYIFLENILIEEFNFLKLFLNKKINYLNKKLSFSNSEILQKLLNLYKLKVYNYNLYKLINNQINTDYNIANNKYKYLNFSLLKNYNNLNYKTNNLNIINMYKYNIYSFFTFKLVFLNNFYYIRTFLLFFQNYFKSFENKIKNNYIIEFSFQTFCNSLFVEFQSNKLFLNDYQYYMQFLSKY